MIKEGSKIFHSLHGLGTVEAIEEKVVLNQSTRFSISRFGSDGLKIMINLDRKDNMVRPVIDDGEVPKVLEYLQSFSTDLPTKAPTRYNLNLGKLKNGDVYSLCEVVKSLTELSTKRKLSPKDQTMLEQTRHHLAQELGYVRDVGTDEMEDMIDQVCRTHLN